MNFRQHITKICVGTTLLGSLAVLALGPTGLMASATQAMPIATCTVNTHCAAGSISVVTTPAPQGTPRAVHKSTPLTPFATPVTPLTACSVGTPCASGTIPVVVTPGALSASTTGFITNNGAPVTLSADDQAVPLKFTTSIGDARGTGVGWGISASATAVTFTAGTAQDPILDTTTPVSIVCAGRSTCANPAAITTGTPGSDLVTAAPVTIASAATGQGLGSYNVTTYGSVLFPGGGGSPTGGGVISVTVSAAPI